MERLPAIMGRGSVASDIGIVRPCAVEDTHVVLTIFAIVFATAVFRTRQGRKLKRAEE